MKAELNRDVLAVSQHLSTWHHSINHHLSVWCQVHHLTQGYAELAFVDCEKHLKTVNKMEYIEMDYK